MKRLRCAVVGSAPVTPEPGYCYAHVLRLPCGRVRVSNAQDPPVTVAACQRCDVTPEPPQRPAFDF